MHIKRIISQHRRDMTAEFECEHCGHTEQASAYDDEHFHNEVVPKLECTVCEKTASANYRPLAPKYPEGMQL